VAADRWPGILRSLRHDRSDLAAGGDVVPGAASVISPVGAGRRAAGSIDDAFGGAAGGGRP
jgi:hypothetical protein